MVSSLYVEVPGEPPFEVRLDKDLISVGRAEENVLGLRDMNVSRHHFVIERRENTWLVRDKGSRNGTLVNRQPVYDKVLRDGDKIEVGGSALTFRAQASRLAVGTAEAPRPKPSPALRESSLNTALPPREKPPPPGVGAALPAAPPPASPAIPTAPSGEKASPGEKPAPAAPAQPPPIGAFATRPLPPQPPAPADRATTPRPPGTPLPGREGTARSPAMPRGTTPMPIFTPPVSETPPSALPRPPVAAPNAATPAKPMPRGTAAIPPVPMHELPELPATSPERTTPLEVKNLGRVSDLFEPKTTAATPKPPTQRPDRWKKL